METIGDYKELNMHSGEILKENEKIANEISNEWSAPEMGDFIYKIQCMWANLYLEVLGYNNFKYSQRLISELKLLNKHFEYALEYDEPQNMLDHAKKYIDDILGIVKKRDYIIGSIISDDKEYSEVKLTNVQLNGYTNLFNYERNLSIKFDIIAQSIEEDYNIEMGIEDIKKLELDYFNKYNEILQNSEELLEVAQYLEECFEILDGEDIDIEKIMKIKTHNNKK